MEKLISPLVLKILRLDHDGMPSEDIANEVKLSTGEINRFIGSYRVRYFLAFMESKRKKESFLLDVYQGMPSKELAKKYKLRESYITSIISADRFRTNVEKITIRCDHCTNVLKFEFSRKPRYCPRCGYNLKSPSEVNSQPEQEQDD